MLVQGVGVRVRHSQIPRIDSDYVEGGSAYITPVPLWFMHAALRANTSF